MKEFFKLNKDETIIDQLFIQPTYYCAGKCKDCYVFAHEKYYFAYNEEYVRSPLDEQIKFFKSFYDGPHWANQISISVDELPDDVEKAAHMADYITSVLSVALVSSREEKPELHLTLRSIRTLESYCKAGVPLFLWGTASVISFSEINCWPEPIEQLRDAGVKINLNKIGWADASTPEVMVVDSVYILLKKPQLIWHPKMLYFLQPHKKIQRDICAHHLEHDDCNANISKFQIWPDGSASGCPYIVWSDTGPGLTAEKMVKNIIKSSKEENFRECPLKSVNTSGKSFPAKDTHQALDISMSGSVGTVE
jgi:hypothetical protein